MILFFQWNLYLWGVGWIWIQSLRFYFCAGIFLFKLMFSSNLNYILFSSTQPNWIVSIEITSLITSKNFVGRRISINVCYFVHFRLLRRQILLIESDFWLKTQRTVRVVYSDHGADRQRKNCTVGNVRKDANPKFNSMEATNEEFQELFF